MFNIYIYNYIYRGGAEFGNAPADVIGWSHCEHCWKREFDGGLVESDKPPLQTDLVAQRNPCAMEAVQGKAWLGSTTALAAEATHRGSNEISMAPLDALGVKMFEV